MLSNAFSSVSRSYAARETLFSRTHFWRRILSTAMQRDVINDGFPVFERTPKTRDARARGGLVNNMTADAMGREQYRKRLSQRLWKKEEGSSQGRFLRRNL
jgi:hypothetical protein